MSSAAFFFTGFTLLCALVSAASVYFCLQHELELRRSISRIASNEQEIQIAFAQLHKLRQKIYANNFENKQSEIVQRAERSLPSAACENWTFAQTEGPASKAAHCECAYCTAKRAERDELRARLVPKRTERSK